MSRDWVRSLADDGVEIRWRGNQPGVNWTSVEAYIQRCRIAGRANDTLLRQVHPDQPLRGVARLDRVKARFDWSDHDVADALGVYPSAVSRYRLTGVPDRQLRALRNLGHLDPQDVALPRRVRWAQRERKSKKARASTQAAS
jgi:hypothetical protein